MPASGATSMLTWTRGSPSTVTSGGKPQPGLRLARAVDPATSIGSVWSIDSCADAASSPPTVTVGGVTWTDDDAQAAPRLADELGA